MRRRWRLVVIGGGRSQEHDVSLASASAVAASLVSSGHEVSCLTIDPHGVWSLDSDVLGSSPAQSLAGALGVLDLADAAVPVLHGRHGEDGTVAALCELADVPYVGCDVAAGAFAMDKWATKLIASDAGVPVAPGFVARRGRPWAFSWDGPVIVKPLTGGSSHGVSLVTDEHQLSAALESAWMLDERVLVERLVVGREIDVAVLEDPMGRLIVSPPLEIVTSGPFSTDEKYNGSAVFEVPARLEAPTVDLIERTALAVFAALGCAGVARIDFFLTSTGLVLNEVNTMPGMTPLSQLPRMFDAAGLSYDDVLQTLVATAIRRGRLRSTTATGSDHDD